MQDSTLADIDYPDFSIFIFKVNCVLMEEKDNPVERVVTEISCILNLENLPRTVFVG